MPFLPVILIFLILIGGFGFFLESVCSISTDRSIDISLSLFVLTIVWTFASTFLLYDASKDDLPLIVYIPGAVYLGLAVVGGVARLCGWSTWGWVLVIILAGWISERL